MSKVHSDERAIGQFIHKASGSDFLYEAV